MSIEKSEIHDVFALTDHAKVVADTLDSSLFIGDDELTIQELIGKEAQRTYADESILGRLTVLLGTESSMAAEYSHTNSFLAGAVIALLASDKLAELKLGECTKYRELWLSKKSLFSVSCSPVTQEFDLYEAVGGVDAHEVELEYSDAALELGGVLMPGHDEKELFHAGFVHMLVNAKACIAELVVEAAAEAAAASEFDFEAFFEKYDLTGSLQEVYHAYLDHLIRTNIDPITISDDQGRIVMDLTHKDYERLVPKMEKVEIKGPSFFALLQNAHLNDPEIDVSIGILNEDCRLVGTVEALSLTIAPTDRSYIYKTVEEGCALTHMPAFVLRDAMLTTATGEQVSIASGEQILHVGIAVPGSKYRAVDQ